MCMFHHYLEVVAPPMSRGIFIPILSISLATKIISSSEGVISPERPTMSAGERGKGEGSERKEVRRREERSQRRRERTFVMGT